MCTSCLPRGSGLSSTFRITPRPVVAAALTISHPHLQAHGEVFKGRLFAPSAWPATPERHAGTENLPMRFCIFLPENPFPDEKESVPTPG